MGGSNIQVPNPNFDSAGSSRISGYNAPDLPSTSLTVARSDSSALITLNTASRPEEFDEALGQAEKLCKKLKTALYGTYTTRFLI
jgi:hypothetical protein